MKTIDREQGERLRESLRVVAGTVEPPHGLVARIQGAARQANVSDSHDSSRRRAIGQSRWRWLLPAVAASIVALIVVGSVLFVVRLPADPTPVAVDPVPWSSVGGVSTTELAQDIEPTVAPQGTRDCTSDDFRVVTSPATSSTLQNGWVETAFLLESTTISECAVSQYGMNVALIDARGVALPQDAPWAAGPPRAGPYLVRPSQLVRGAASWTVVAGASAAPTDLVILPTSGSDSPSSERSGLRVSVRGVAVPRRPTPPSNVKPWRAGIRPAHVSVVDSGTPHSLTATIAAPSSVKLGQPLSYDVTLRNDTEVAVGLEPCPDVIQVLSVVPVKSSFSTGSRQRLNCGGAPSTIAPGSAVTFRMRLDPHGTVAGAGLLKWQLVTSGRAVVSGQALIEVTP